MKDSKEKEARISNLKNMVVTVLAVLRVLQRSTLRSLSRLAEVRFRRVMLQRRESCRDFSVVLRLPN